MGNWRFIFVSAGIFLAEYLLSFFWPFLLRAELFIFLIKRVMLVDNRPNFSALLWLTGFYYFYLFTKGILYNFGGPYIFPNLSIINLIETVSWVSATLIIYKIASHEKKI